MSLFLLAVLTISIPEQNDIITYDYSGNDGCSFTVSVGQPSFRSYEDRFFPVIPGMGIASRDNEYVLPVVTCYIPVPPGCEPEIDCVPSGIQPVSIPGPLLVTPVMTGNGLDTQFEIPSIVPPFESNGYVDLRTMRIAGTTVAAVTVNPFGGGNTGSIPREITVRLSWAPVAGSRRIDSPLLRAVSHPDLLFWPNTPTDLSGPFWGSPWARMAVSSTGIYAVTGSELEQAGCEIIGTPSRTLRVFSGPGTQFDLEDPADEHQLSELAVDVCDGGDGVFNQSDTLKFFAFGLNRFDVSNDELVRLRHRYATHNVYWLTWGGEDGQRTDTVSALPDASPEWGNSLSYSMIQEQEYAWVASQEKQTGWVWTRLYENIPSYFYFSTISHLGEGSISLSLVPEYGNYGPHEVEVSLNGTLIMDSVWTGSNEISFDMDEIEFDPAVNLLKVTSHESKAMYFNYFTVNYPRSLSYAANRMLRFTDSVPGRYNFTLGGAENEYSLFDVTDPAAPVRLHGQLSGSELDVALDISNSSQFWLSSGSDYYRSPDSITVSEPGRITGTGIHGDVVIIVADQLFGAAEPIEQIYAGRGLSTALVRAGEVYDEFGQGIRDPGAIRSFFRYTQDSWSQPAQYLLLIGDGSYDPMMHVTSYPTLIPVCIHFDSEHGTNTDDTYVIAHQNGELPEVPISRITASTEDELTAYFQKVTAYESREESGQWENRIILAADDEWGNALNEFSHTRSCELLADTVLPSCLDRDKFYMIEYPWPPGTSPSGIHPEKPEARQDFITELSAGCANMIFFGHGSYGQLAHEKLLLSSDVELIENGSRLPVMIFASCDLGHFDMISANCLAEDFELKPGSGSIASIGATRGTYSYQNESLFSHYYSEIYDSSGGSENPCIAEALWLSKISFPGIYRNTGRKYVVLGDGGIHTVFPSEEGCSFDVQADTLYRGRINTVSGSFTCSSIGFLNVTESGDWRSYTGIGTGSVTYLKYGSSVYSAFITDAGQDFEASFFIPLQADTGSFSRGSNVGISVNNSEVAFDEWVVTADNGNYATDSVPPSIELWIEGFRGEDMPSVRGNAVLRAVLSDSSGICAMGGGAGRSILLSLDTRGFDVSSYFTYRPDSYTSGEVAYSLPEMIEGDHRIILVAWDGMGNSARDTLDFKVTGLTGDLLSSVFVYPNPGEGQRCFNFDAASHGTAVITVYTVAGRTVWRETVSCSDGYNQVLWNGLDMDCDELGSGAYIYRIDYSTADGMTGSVTDILAVVRER